MRETIGNFILVLALTLQIGGFVRVFDAHPSHASDNSEASGLSVTAAHSHTGGDSDQEPAPTGHHHCKSHPAGGCCAYISLTEVRLVPDFKDQTYGLKSDFFFFELASSHLRPPALRG